MNYRPTWYPPCRPAKTIGRFLLIRLVPFGRFPLTPWPTPFHPLRPGGTTVAADVRPVHAIGDTVLQFVDGALLVVEFLPKPREFRFVSTCRRNRVFWIIFDAAAVMVLRVRGDGGVELTAIVVAGVNAVR